MEERKYDKKQIKDGKALAIISYIGILSLIPFLCENDNNFVRYHAKQGLNLFILEAIGCAIGAATCWILIGFIILPLVSVAGLVFSILGIVDVCDGKANELPIIGSIKFVK